MKRFFQVIVFLLVALVGLLVFANLKARWEMDERRAAIDQAIADRIARATADNNRKNALAARLQQEALKEEAAAQARWDAAKARGALPADNTKEGFTPATGGSNR